MKREVVLVTININQFWDFLVFFFQICKEISYNSIKSKLLCNGKPLSYTGLILFKYTVVHTIIPQYDKCPFPYKDTLLFVYLMVKLTVQTFSFILNRKWFYFHYFKEYQQSSLAWWLLFVLHLMTWGKVCIRTLHADHWKLLRRSKEPGTLILHWQPYCYCSLIPL